MGYLIHLKNHLLQFLLLLAILTHSSEGKSQVVSDSNRLYFISDCQQPAKIEELRLRPYRNKEARDSLFSDIVQQKPRNLFLLGDLTLAGSKKYSWIPIEKLQQSLHLVNSQLYAIPGNHEYLTNARRGLQYFSQLFPGNSVYGYCVREDSIAILMLNSNFKKLTSREIQKQQDWYLAMMDSLDSDRGIKMILLCSHHPPFTNSKIVKPSVEVARYFLPRFFDSPKSRLYISGHSHNLELFSADSKKYFVVIGGGGGLSQPIYSGDKRLYKDLLQQEEKPVYFYLVTERRGDSLYMYVRGLPHDFKNVQTFEIGSVQ